MRPLYIEMTAFGSYGKRTKIDFTNISQNLFLISGETGSGKTTIFDAIVFALYGQASSVKNEKKGLLLQSQFVSIQDKPMVRFAFEEKKGDSSQVYTVVRVPKHMRPKKVKKGSNDFIVENGYTELLLPDGSAYTERNVDEKIEEIVGLSREQFMQVAMIAQGEFMEVLRATTDTKKEIFRKLFSTEIYEKITRILESRKKEKEIELAKIKTMCQSEISRVIVPEPSNNFEYHEEFMELHGLLMKENITNLKDYLKVLEKWCDSNDTDRKECKKELDAGKERLKKINDEYAKAQALKAGFESLRTAQDILNQYSEKEEKIKKDRELKSVLERAYEVKAFYDGFAENQALLKKTEDEIRKMMNEIPEAKETEEKLRIENEEKKKNFDREKEKYISIKSKVDEALKTFEKIKEKEKEYGHICDKLERKKTDSDRVDEDIKKERASLEKLNKIIEEYSDARIKMEKCTGDLNYFMEAVRKCDNIHELEQEMMSLNDSLTDLKNRLAMAKKEFEKQDDSYRRLNEIYIEGHLGVLAKEIEEGKPCPLCGSIEHPHIYSGNEESDVSRDDIKKAEIKRNKCNENLRSISDELAKCMAKYELFIRQRKENIESLHEFVEFKGEEYAAAIEARKHELNELHKRYSREVKESDIAKAGLNECEKKIESYTKQFEELRQQTVVLREEVSASLSALKEMKSGSNFESEEEARLQERNAKKQMDDSGGKYEEVHKSYEMAKKKVQDLEVLLKNIQKSYPDMQEKCEQKEKLYMEEMKKQLFNKESEWADYTRNHEKNEIASLSETISDYERIMTEAKAKKKAALEIIMDNEEPDLLKLTEQREEAEEFLNECDSAYMRAYNRYSTNMGVLKTLQGHFSNQEKTVREYGKMISLYRRISGNVSGSNKIDLETFVQRYYLRRILYNANKRFEIMTAGQFRLLLKDIDEAGKGKNEGLDLMVYSLVTGKKREIRTLSGGESFMAALSIALGMADQIKADNSIVQIDMMFIDEGFGSLDEHSRNQAVRILKEMAGGDRLIGIISHVTELKHEIGERLLVTKDESGSSVRWVRE